MKSSQLDDDANVTSEDACLNLFGWHRYNEEGLWLAEVQDDIDTSRKKTLHPWITYESDTQPAFKTPTQVKVVDWQSVARWRDNVILRMATDRKED